MLPLARARESRHRLDFQPLPVSITHHVLESILRNYDGKKVAESSVRELAQWQPKAAAHSGNPVHCRPYIVLQDFTGCATARRFGPESAMRSATVKLGKNPKIIRPLVPVDLVVDHFRFKSISLEWRIPWQKISTWNSSATESATNS